MAWALRPPPRAPARVAGSARTPPGGSPAPPRLPRQRGIPPAAGPGRTRLAARSPARSPAPADLAARCGRTARSRPSSSPPCRQPYGFTASAATAAKALRRRGPSATALAHPGPGLAGASVAGRAAATGRGGAGSLAVSRVSFAIYLAARLTGPLLRDRRHHHHHEDHHATQPWPAPGSPGAPAPVTSPGNVPGSGSPAIRKPPGTTPGP